jgi:hypothetical protein
MIMEIPPLSLSKKIFPARPAERPPRAKSREFRPVEESAPDIAPPRSH